MYTCSFLVAFECADVAESRANGLGSPQILGSREDQEDRYSVLNPGQLKSRKEVALFAVYDGQYVIVR